MSKKEWEKDCILKASWRHLEAILERKSEKYQTPMFQDMGSGEYEGHQNPSGSDGIDEWMMNEFCQGSKHADHKGRRIYLSI